MSVSADTITAIPFNLISTAQDTLDNSEDYYLATKHYVDTRIKSVADKETAISASLSSVITEISEIRDFNSTFKVNIPNNIKPDQGTGIATIGTIVTPKHNYPLNINVSDYARIANPDFTGIPKAPTAGEGTATTQIATTAFVMTAINTLSVAKQPYSPVLLSIAQLDPDKNKIIYTTASNTYATSDITNFTRSLLGSESAVAARNILSVPGNDGTGARGTWDITAKKATTAEKATTAIKDSDGEQINITYAKISDIEVSNTLSQGTKIATVKVKNVSKDINVDLSGYAPVKSPTFTGEPKSVTPKKNDNSTKIATTAFVTRAVQDITGVIPGDGSSTVNNLTMAEIYNAIGGDINFSTTVMASLSGKQDKSAALTSIADLDTSANKMIYTVGKDFYAITPLTAFGREILKSQNATDLRDKMFSTVEQGGTGQSSTVINITVNNALSSLVSNTAISAITAVTAINDDNGDKISTSYVKIADLHNINTPTNLGWVSFADGKAKATSLNSLAYWNGRYDSTHSNLAYCKLGKFGDIVTHNMSDFVTQENMTNIQNTYNYSLSNYLTTTEVANNYLSISSASSIFLSKTEKAATAVISDKAVVLQTPRSFYVSDYNSLHKGVASTFDGSSDITIKLPEIIAVNLAGEPTAPTPDISNNSTRVATTAFVQSAIANINIPDVTSEALSASSSNKLTNAQLLDGFSFNGTAGISRYCVCDTPADTVLKTVTLPLFSLVTGARITVRFVNQNTAASPQLSVSGSAAKFIYYRGHNIPAAAIRSNSTYDLVYNGTTWDIVGSLIWSD